METFIENWQWIDYEEVASTNDLAMEMQLTSDKQKLVISAKCQTKGRGRRGRNWISEEGNLFFSQLFKTEILPSELAFVSSLSIAKTILEFNSKAQVQLKWPNDVLINGKKVCGILIEAQPDGAAILGIGVNISSFPKEETLNYRATSLKEEKIDTSREAFLCKYLQVFEKTIAQCKKVGFAHISREWQSYAYKMNEPIIVRGEKKQQEGIFKGIDEKGFLLLEQKGKIYKISVGEVFPTAAGLKDDYRVQ